jgi:hypothetical protein
VILSASWLLILRFFQLPFRTALTALADVPANSARS